MGSDSKLMDTRIVRRNVKRGLISQKEVDTHIKNLPDEKDNAEFVTIDLENSEISEVPSNSGSTDSSPELGGGIVPEGS